ncbi:MAG: hypothetical protein KC422_23075 [Trueperaceae bacterium]|nr:hypothetical protein [Trueperaceae bacterium]
MNFFRQMHRQLTGALGVLSEAPPVQTNQAQFVQATGPAAVALSNKYNVALLEAADFTAGIWRESDFNPIGTFRVPYGTRYILPAGRKLRMFLRSKKTFAGNNTTSASRTLTGITGLIESTQKITALPASFNPNIVVWAKVGSTWSLATITAIDYSAKTVTITEPDNCTDLEVWYLSSVGEWRFRVYDAKGADNTQAVTVMNGSFAALHTIDQTNDETNLKWLRDVSLVPGQQLALEVKTSLETVLHSRSQTVITLFSYLQQLEINNLSALRKASTIDLIRGG